MSASEKTHSELFDDGFLADDNAPDFLFQLEVNSAQLIDGLDVIFWKLFFGWTHSVF